MNSNFIFRQYSLSFKFPVSFFNDMITEKTGVMALRNNIPVADFPLTHIGTLKNYGDILNYFDNMNIRTKHDTENAFCELQKLNLPAAVAFGIMSLLSDKSATRNNGTLNTCKISSYPFFDNYEHLADYSDRIPPKIKFSPETKCIDAIHNFFRRTGIRIRLDFNRRFCFSEAAEYLNLLSPQAILYVEEPCNDTAQFPAMQNLTGIKYALDETIIAGEDDATLLEQCSYLILKPSLSNRFTLIPKFIENGKSVIISSAYETPVGVNALKRLIAFYDLEGQYHGLDTAKFTAKFEWK